MSLSPPVMANNWARKKIELARDHQEMVFTHGLNGLEIVDRDDKQIILRSGERLVEFLSCSYLGLETDARLIEAAVTSIRHYGVQFAAARTRAAVTPMREYDELLGMVFQGHTITFNSVGSAHLGCLPLIASGELPSYPIAAAGPCWLMDKAAHASMQVLQGLLQQFGPLRRLDVCDLDMMETACRDAVAAGHTPVILTDSVGSMQGLYPVRELLGLAERFGGYLYADDAHGTSIHGERGGGYALAACGNQPHPKLILLSSLSKAFGATGGAITLASAKDADVVRRHCVTYIFGGPLSLGGVAAGVESARIHLSPDIARLQTALWDNVSVLDTLLGPTLGNHGIASPIRFIRVGDERNAINLALRVRQKGFAVTTAMFPAVGKGQAILRLGLSASHLPKQLAGLALAVQEGARDLNIAGITTRNACNSPVVAEASHD